MSPEPENLAVLVPVKDLARAKTRLSPLLTLEERRTLAWTMLEGVLRGIADLEIPWRRVVVTSYGPAAELARQLRFEVIREERQLSESHSVDSASASLEEDGVDGVLRVPLDLPLFRPAALMPVFAAALGGRSAILVPARDRMGTNALYRSPPTLFPSRFGANSLVLHEREARRRTTSIEVLPVAELALDIDDVEDVAELMRRDASSPASQYLASIGIADRLEARDELQG